MYTVIYANKDQAVKLYEKHMMSQKNSFWFGKTLHQLFDFKFSYDDEDDIGFFSCKTKSGKKISCQVRGNKPMFVEFTGFENIRYDIAYPEQLSQEMYDLLYMVANEARENFWKGGEI